MSRRECSLQGKHIYMFRWFGSIGSDGSDGSDGRVNQTANQCNQIYTRCKIEKYIQPIPLDTAIREHRIAIALRPDVLHCVSHADQSGRDSIDSLDKVIDAIRGNLVSTIQPNKHM